MTVFSVVLAWVSPKLLSAVDPAKREGLVEQLRSEAGVLVSLRQDDTLQVHGKWHSVQKAFGILEEVESFVNPEDESDDDDTFSSAASVFGSHANPQVQEQNIVESSDQSMLDIKPILPPPSAIGSGHAAEAEQSADGHDDLEESVSDVHDAESNISDNLEIVEDEDDEDFVVDDDEDDEDYVADVKVTPRSKATTHSRRRAKQTVKPVEPEEDPSWKPSKRKRGRPRKITTSAVPKRSPRSSLGDSGTPLNVRDFAVDVADDDVEKYMEMLKNCSGSTPKGRGRGRPKLNENCVPEVVFVYSPRGTEKVSHNDPRFQDYVISKLETGARVADFIDQFDNLIKQNGDVSGILETLKPDAEGAVVGMDQTEETQETESTKDLEKDEEEKGEVEDKSESSKDDKRDDEEDQDNDDDHEDENDQQQFMKALATVVQEVMEGGRKSFKCPKCDYTQSERNSVTRHIQRQHLMRRFLCLVCNRSCGTRPDMRKHLRRHREMHMCALCGMQYQDIRHMSEHLLTHKDGYVKPMFPCLLCDKIFSSKYVLKTHVESVHEGKKKQVPCPICSKCFTQKQNMLEHMNIHTNDRPFVCPICSKGFHSRTSLKNHKILHTDARNYMCQVCGKTFRQRLSWKSHMKIHTGQADHACDFCGKRFTQKQAMQRHRRVHTRERPYVCEFCGDAFSDKSILRRHLMGIHKNYHPSRPYNQVIDNTGKPIPPPAPPEETASTVASMEMRLPADTVLPPIGSQHDQGNMEPGQGQNSMALEVQGDQANIIANLNLADPVNSAVTASHSHTPVPTTPLSGSNTPVPSTTPASVWQNSSTPSTPIPQVLQGNHGGVSNQSNNMASTSQLPGGLTHEQLAAYMYSAVQPMYHNFYDGGQPPQWSNMKPDGYNQHDQNQ